MSRIPILVTGAGGMLGSAITASAAASPHFIPHPLSHGDLDVRDTAAVMAQADLVAGGWIVHCAAMVDVKRGSPHGESGVDSA